MKENSTFDRVLLMKKQLILAWVISASLFNIISHSNMHELYMFKVKQLDHIKLITALCEPLMVI